jgi:DNA-binding beta-propeller fold protein YncE
VLALVFAVLGAVVPSAMAHERGVLYTQTNDPAGNAVQRFDRAADGSLSPAGTFATGGAGLATLGGRQGAVTLSGDGRNLYAVNAGSGSVSAFRVGRHRTVLLGSVPSGGVAPDSVDEDRGRVYVLNSGGTPSVSAFWRRFDGSLKAIPGGTRALAPGADGAAQVSVAPDGRSLVVTERLANRLETLPLDRLGRPGAPVVTPVERRGAVRLRVHPARRLVVLRGRAQHGVVVPAGSLRTITASLPVGFGAACWVAVSPDGRSPTPATPAAASAASRSRVTAR